MYKMYSRRAAALQRAALTAWRAAAAAAHEKAAALRALMLRSKQRCLQGVIDKSAPETSHVFLCLSERTHLTASQRHQKRVHHLSLQEFGTLMVIVGIGKCSQYWADVCNARAGGVRWLRRGICSGALCGPASCRSACPLLSSSSGIGTASMKMFRYAIALRQTRREGCCQGRRAFTPSHVAPVMCGKVMMLTYRMLMLVQDLTAGCRTNVDLSSSRGWQKFSPCSNI